MPARQNGRVASNAQQKLLVIKENAKYSFVELGKFNTSLYTRRILKRFWRVHHAARCTTMLHQQLIEVWTLSAARVLIPPIPLWALQLPPDSDFIQSQKRAKLAPDHAVLSPAVPIVQSKLRAVTKTQSTALNPFLRVGSVHGISTVYSVSTTFGGWCFLHSDPKPKPLKRLKLLLESR